MPRPKAFLTLKSKTYSQHTGLLSRYAPYLLIAPAVAYMAFFVGYPLLQGVRLAFFTEDGRFTLENLEYLFNSPFSMFWDAFLYTLGLAAVVIPIEAGLAIGLSMLFSLRFWGKNAALYVVILPLILSDVVAGLIWYSMLSANGFLNKLLISIGIIDSPIYFFGAQFKNMEFLAIVLAEVWRSTAIVFVIVFAGLQMVSSELIEAAEVFGANPLQKIRHIILPLLKPSLQAALIIRTLFALQIFGDVWILAGRDIPVLAGEAYYEQVELHHPGVAAIYALIIAGISLAIGFLYIKLLRAKYLEEEVV